MTSEVRSPTKTASAPRRPARSKKRPGRPLKLTPEVQQRIVDAVRAGNYREVVARFAGVGVSTLYLWLERGEAEQTPRQALEADGLDPGPASPYVELLEAVTRAEAEAEIRAVAVLQKAMLEDWRAAAEYLQRRHPRRWSKTDRHEVEHAGRVDTRLTHDLSKLTVGEKRDLLELLEKTRAAS